ncbi:MAG TPA: hypothetical protein VG898_06090 [Solirubrobacterales bacterium]|nr:hypothetical protein [Solirubrobacterales bacterium]
MASAAEKAGRALLALAALLALGLLIASSASAGPASTRLVYAPGEIVPLPASIPHEAGDMVDRRIVGDLRWIAARYPIYVTDGYSGPLPNGEHVGCDMCHTRGSDHYNGLAVDLVPLGGGGRCDASWAPITRLAEWAEPEQNHPVPPFRWVGYDGDAGHGCGNHLHLSWQHAAAPMFGLAEWVEVFPVGPAAKRKPRHPRPKSPPQKLPTGPPGGVGTVHSGGLSPRGD